MFTKLSKIGAAAFVFLSLTAVASAQEKKPAKPVKENTALEQLRRMTDGITHTGQVFENSPRDRRPSGVDVVISTRPATVPAVERSTTTAPSNSGKPEKNSGGKVKK